MLNQWLKSIERRKQLYPDLFNGEQCLRVIHSEGTPLRGDLLGPVLQLGWWSDSLAGSPTEDQIAQLMTACGAQSYALTFHSKKISEKKKLPSSLQETTWIASEHNVKYVFYQDQGVSPGLFLDQRSQRQWIQKNSMNKKVLNLFCYTAGFSLNAAIGAASHVTSVDLSQKYIDWSKKNFSINQIDLHSEKYRFYAMDSLEFLKWSKKKNETYDIIICDPPSFSRNKSTVFKIEVDYTVLLAAMAEILSPQGIILFSTNFEGWSWQKWQKQLEVALKPLNLKITPAYNTQFDFEEDPRTSIMKAFQINY